MDVIISHLKVIKHKKKDILIYLNSPGGGVYAGLGIYDTMQYINPDVSIITLYLFNYH